MNETTEISLDILAIKTSEVVDIKENIKHIRSLKNIYILTSIGVTWRDNNTLSSLLSRRVKPVIAPKIKPFIKRNNIKTINIVDSGLG